MEKLTTCDVGSSKPKTGTQWLKSNAKAGDSCESGTQTHVSTPTQEGVSSVICRFNAWQPKSVLRTSAMPRLCWVTISAVQPFHTVTACSRTTIKVSPVRPRSCTHACCSETPCYLHGTILMDPVSTSSCRVTTSVTFSYSRTESCVGCAMPGRLTVRVATMGTSVAKIRRESLGTSVGLRLSTNLVQ